MNTWHKDNYAVKRVEGLTDWTTEWLSEWRTDCLWVNRLKGEKYERRMKGNGDGVTQINGGREGVKQSNSQSLRLQLVSSKTEEEEEGSVEAEYEDLNEKCEEREQIALSHRWNGIEIDQN